MSVAPSDSETYVVAAEGARLSVVKDVALLFAPGREGLFEADSWLADIWPRLRVGISREQFLAEALSAQRDGVILLRDLREAGALAFIRTKDAPIAISARCCIVLGNVSLSVNFSGAGNFGPLRDMIAHLEVTERGCDRHLLVIGRPDRVGFALSDGDTGWHPWEQAAPALKVMLTDFALAALDGVALHVATLSGGDDALLLVGAPGAGKSTLSVALGASGFRLEGDDIAALQPDGRVMALAFPATVKDGAWSALAPHRPDLAGRTAYLRPDGQRVRYLALEPGAPPERRVRAVLCLDRTAKSPAGLTPLDVPQSVAALLEGAWSADKKLAGRDFDAAMACIGGADFYRMTYTSLDEAVALTRAAFQTSDASEMAVVP